MLVTLMGKKSLYKVTLPKVPIGNYWLTDNSTQRERKLINIEGKNGCWQIKTDRNVKVINPKDIAININNISLKKAQYSYNEGLVLKEHCMYAIRFGNLNDIYILYCSPAVENDIIHLKMNNNNEQF